MEPNKARGVGIVGRRMPPHLPRLAECIPANASGHGGRQREPVMGWKVFPDSRRVDAHECDIACYGVGCPGTRGEAMNGPNDPGPYKGPERRKGKDRRQGHDRREEIRFEPAKDDRRSGKDRRKQTGWDRIR
jgi:hypothetical protein